MSTYEWELREPPQYKHRHYAVSVDGKKAVWNGADKQRIVSVTTVLDGGQDRLTDWAARQGVAAGEMVARRWLGADDALDESVLAFGELAALQPEHPHTYRDLKAQQGTALHNYLAASLVDDRREQCSAALGLPYGLRAAVDGFCEQWQPSPVCDLRGPRVERAVGDYERAVAGTYDGQVRMERPEGGRYTDVHRMDAKSSNMLQPKHFAQVSEYEREAVLGGEEPSDWLTVAHFTPLGEYHVYSIAVGSAEHRIAQGVFDAALTIHRSTPLLAKLLTHHQEDS